MISKTGVVLLLVDHCVDKTICGEHGQCLNQPKEETPDGRGYICVCDEGWEGVDCNECKF